MAITQQGLECLLLARHLGASFEHFCMIGRQNLKVDAGPLWKILRKAGLGLSRQETKNLLAGAQGFSEPLLRLLGARQVDSVDASPFENASIIHDMNLPIGENLKNCFSTVLDGGSLEHIFNFPCALRNCMEMVAPGGYFLGLTPANNWTGHGFYQFSPELYFRAFSPDNGFDLVRIFAFENRPFAPRYEVMDASLLGGRLKLVNRVPTLLFVVARKATALALILAVAPQQSDYVAKWQEPRRTNKSSWRIRLPRPVKDVFLRLGALFTKNPFNSRYFKPISSS
jgi:hypothetical protein